LHPLTPEQKHYKGLVAQYGEENVQKLYEAFDSFKAKISTGDLEYQIKKLSLRLIGLRKRINSRLLPKW
jgi:hypothetical protein